MPDPHGDRRPQGCGELFGAFTWLALQGWGGVLPVAQREIVERRRWLSREQFLDTLSLAQVLPGPNVANLALMLGDRWYGWRGALAALGGLLAAPLVIVLVLAALALHLQDSPMVAGGLRGMGVAAAGLVLASALRLAQGLRGNVLGPSMAALGVGLTLLAVGVLRWPLPAVVGGLGLLACTIAWRRLKN